MAQHLQDIADPDDAVAEGIATALEWLPEDKHMDLLLIAGRANAFSRTVTSAGGGTANCRRAYELSGLRLLNVGVLDGFLTTWQRALATFGEGSPQGGDGLDQSAQLRSLQHDLESVAAGDWTGVAWETYAEANRRQSRVLAAIAELDERLKAEVDRSAAVVSAGRRDLEAVRQWVLDAAAGVSGTPLGEQLLWPVVSRGAAEVAEIVERSNAHLAAIAGRVRTLGADYDALSPPDSQGESKHGQWQ